MDHMRISGTEPSSVILSQTCSIKKLKSYDQKLPKQAEAKRDGVINPQNNERFSEIIKNALLKQNEFIPFSLLSF